MQGFQSVMDYFRRTNKIYWFLMLVISAYSLLLMKTIPSSGSGRSYFSTMLVATVIGYIGVIILTVMDYHDISSLWYIIAGFCLFLMVYTLKFGKSVTNSGGVNARAWIYIGSQSFQPSELVKIGFMVTFAKHLSVLKERGLMKSPIHVFLLAFHVLIPMALVHLQGDDGAGIIFFCMFLAMAFGAGVQLRYFAALFAMFCVALPVAWKYVLADYQKQRILVTYHLDSNSEAALTYAWQQIQGRTSIGSGGMWGRGLFQSPRVNSRIVPVQQSDLIFSVAGEQLGFIGCCAIILLILFFLWRTLHIASKSSDLLGSSICMGFFGMIAAQAIFNLGMCLDLLPVMGVTLPFFSYGGSSAVCLYFGFGLVQSVAMHQTGANRLTLKRVGQPGFL